MNKARDYVAFSKAIAEMFAGAGGSVATEADVTAYWKILEDLPLRDVESAITRLRRENAGDGFKLTDGQIREAAIIDGRRRRLFDPRTQPKQLEGLRIGSETPLTPEQENELAELRRQCVWFGQMEAAKRERENREKKGRR